MNTVIDIYPAIQADNIYEACRKLLHSLLNANDQPENIFYRWHHACDNFSKRYTDEYSKSIIKRLNKLAYSMETPR